MRDKDKVVISFCFATIGFTVASIYTWSPFIVASYLCLALALKEAFSCG